MSPFVTLFDSSQPHLPPYQPLDALRAPVALPPGAAEVLGTPFRDIAEETKHFQAPITLIELGPYHWAAEVTFEEKGRIIHRRWRVGQLSRAEIGRIRVWSDRVCEGQRVARIEPLNAMARTVRVERQGGKLGVVIRRDGDDPHPLHVMADDRAVFSTAMALRRKLLFIMHPTATPEDVNAVLTALDFQDRTGR